MTNRRDDTDLLLYLLASYSGKECRTSGEADARARARTNEIVPEYYRFGIGFSVAVTTSEVRVSLRGDTALSERPHRHDIKTLK